MIVFENVSYSAGGIKIINGVSFEIKKETLQLLWEPTEPESRPLQGCATDCSSLRAEQYVSAALIQLRSGRAG